MTSTLTDITVNAHQSITPYLYRVCQKTNLLLITRQRFKIILCYSIYTYMHIYVTVRKLRGIECYKLKIFEYFICSIME